MLGNDSDVLAAVKDGRTLLREAVQLAPDIVLIDISMAMLNGIAFHRREF
jgi:DNA-binding NarL/FixJ family response regulator